MDRWKAEQGRGREKRKIRRKKSKKKEDADAWKGRKVAKHCVFPMIWGSGGSKSRLAKAAGAEPAGQMRDEKLHAVVARSTFPSEKVQKHLGLGALLEVEMSKKCTPLWREAHFEVKMYKTHHVRTTFGSCDVEKVHAVVARSTFPSQNVQNTRGADHFWKLRCRKSARRCGAKHIWKSKFTKHTRCGPLLAVEMSKKCTPLWHEAHFQVKMLQNTRGSDHVWKFRSRKSARRCGAKHIWKSKCYKAHQGCGPLLAGWDVEKVHAVVVRSTFGTQNVKNTRGSDHVWKFRCRFASLHSTTLNYTTPRYITPH